MSELNWEKLCSLEPRLLDLEAKIEVCHDAFHDRRSLSK